MIPAAVIIKLAPVLTNPSLLCPPQKFKEAEPRLRHMIDTFRLI